MYVEDWQDFVSLSEELFRAAPLRTRFCTKYRHSEGILVLKVTDDVRCLKYKTDQAADVRKLEKLNAAFLSLMARGPDVPYDDLLVQPPQAAPKGSGAGGKGDKVPSGGAGAAVSGASGGGAADAGGSSAQAAQQQQQQRGGGGKKKGRR